jgi:hypothetical protein
MFMKIELPSYRTTYVTIAHRPMSKSQVFAFFLSVPGDTRVEYLESFMRSTMTAQTASIFTYTFVNYKGGANATSIPLPPGWTDLVTQIEPTMDHKSVEMVAMDFFILDYFLANCTEPWFYRGTDDTFVNLPRIPSLISQLNQEFNPFKTVVLRGDCVVHRGKLFLQGGAGFLCSRAAVRLINNVSKYMEFWTGYEDLTLGPFLDSVGIGTRNCCSGLFMGHGPSFLNLGQNQRTCPPQNLSRMPVPYHLVPLRDIVFYHKKDMGGKRLERATPQAMKVFGAAEQIRWVVKRDNFWPQTCRIEGEEVPEPAEPGIGIGTGTGTRTGQAIAAIAALGSLNGVLARRHRR